MKTELFLSLFLGVIGIQSLEYFSILKFLDRDSFFNKQIVWLRIFTIVLALFFLETEFAGSLFAILLAIELFFWKIQRGPLNGASSGFTVLILGSVFLGKIHPSWNSWIMKYLALQVILSYFVAGVVKIRNRGWQDGSYLHSFLKLTPYSPNWPSLFPKPSMKNLKFLSWAVLGFELTFPLAFLPQFFGPSLLGFYLATGALFHLINAYTFGLHRFFWIWISTYPLLWSFAETLR